MSDQPNPQPWSALLKPPKPDASALHLPSKPTADEQSGAARALFLLLTTGAVWDDTLSQWARMRFRELEVKGYVRSDHAWCPWRHPKPGAALRYLLVKRPPDEYMRRSFAAGLVQAAKAGGKPYVPRRARPPAPAPRAAPDPAPCPAPVPNGDGGPGECSPPTDPSA